MILELAESKASLEDIFVRLTTRDEVANGAAASPPGEPYEEAGEATEEVVS